jgi:hypothetical protein
MRIIGSQLRDTLAESGYSLLGRIDPHTVVLEDLGRKEVWAMRNDFAGYVIEIDGVGYEFVRGATMGDLWWMEKIAA